MDGSTSYMLHESDSFRVALIALEVIGFALIVLLLGVTIVYHVYRHPVINAMLVALLLHAAVFIWPGIYDKQLKYDIRRFSTLETATSLVLFCAADAVLVRYMQVVEAAFSVCFMVAILGQARRALHADPQDLSRGISRLQRRPEPAWSVAALCFGPFVWALPVLFAPLPHLMDQNALIVSYSTLYCDIPSAAFHSVSLVFLLLPFVTAILLSAWIFRCLARLYQRHRNSVSSGLDLPLGRRFLAMATLTLISTLLLIVNAATHFSTKALLVLIVVWEGISPLLQFGVFASQREVVAVWLRWLQCGLRARDADNSSRSAYSMQQARENNASRMNTLVSVRDTRPLPALPPPEAVPSTSGSSSAPGRTRTTQPVYQAINIELPGSRLSIPALLRNRTPTPTLQILMNDHKDTPVMPTEGAEYADAETPFSATSISAPLVSSSSRSRYDTPVLPPALPAPTGPQGFYSHKAAPQHFPHAPVVPMRHFSLPAPVQKKPFAGLPGSFTFSPRSAAVPYKIPPPPTRPAPTAPSSTNPSSNGHTTSRPVSVNSSQLSPTTTHSSQSRSLFTRFAPNTGRRSAPAPLKRPSMRELISQFPSSPGTPNFPSFPPPVVPRESLVVGPVRETIQLANPLPPSWTLRPPALETPAPLPRSFERQAASVAPINPAAEQRSTAGTTTTGPASPPGRSLTHREGWQTSPRRRQQRVEETPGSSSSRSPLAAPGQHGESSTLTPARAHPSSMSYRPRSVSRSRSASASSRPADADGLPSPRRDVTRVPPVPSRPVSIVGPGSPARQTRPPRESLPPPLPPKGGRQRTYI